MNKIEKMHLDAIDSYTIVDHDVPIDVDSIKAASKSAMVTEQIAIEFVEWIWINCDEKYMSQHSSESMYKEFLKTKQ